MQKVAQKPTKHPLGKTPPDPRYTALTYFTTIRNTPPSGTAQDTTKSTKLTTQYLNNCLKLAYKTLHIS